MGHKKSNAMGHTSCDRAQIKTCACLHMMDGALNVIMQHTWTPWATHYVSWSKKEQMNHRASSMIHIIYSISSVPVP